MKKIPVSAIIVSCNEGPLLEKCLKSIQFCEEIILVDLYSTDNTKELGLQYTTRYLMHEKVTMADKIKPWAISFAKNDWLLFMDPDEFFLPDLQVQLTDLMLNEVGDRIGVISLPYQFFYKNHFLKGTYWGGNVNRLCLRHKERNEFTTWVHNNMFVKEGYETFFIQRESANYIHHAWVNSFSQLLEKHKRYIDDEGKSLYEAGIRYTFKRHLYWTFKSFSDSFFKYKGYKDGFTGIVLSVFWMWYNFKKWESLRTFQYSIKNN